MKTILNREVSCVWIAVHYNELLLFFDGNALSPVKKKTEFYALLILSVQTLPKSSLFSKDWVKCATSLGDADLLSFVASLNRKFLRMLLALEDLTSQQQKQAGKSKAELYIDSIVNMFRKGVFLNPEELSVSPVLIANKMKDSYQNTPAKNKLIEKAPPPSTPKKRRFNA